MLLPFVLAIVLLFGRFAFLLNYISILGPLTGVAMFFCVGLLTLDTPRFTLMPASVYLALHLAEGETITPCCWPNC